MKQHTQNFEVGWSMDLRGAEPSSRVERAKKNMANDKGERTGVKLDHAVYCRLCLNYFQNQLSPMKLPYNVSNEQPFGYQVHTN